MRVLVCGSRSAWDASEVWRKMDELEPRPELVITGGANGVDTFAAEWAKRRGIPCMVFPAAWDSPLGRGAGPVRNGWMLRFGQPDLVLAFPGGTGTEDMVAKAQKKGVEVRRVRCKVG